MAYCAGLLFLAGLTAEDIRKREVSGCKIVLSAALAVFYRMVSGQLVWNELLGCLLPGAALLVLSLITRESIGYGDGMAVAALGLWMGGWFTLTVLGIGIILAGIFGALCLLGKREKEIPFIPFLLVGMEVALIFGQKI